ncbi:MAG TPA: ABC transporter permease, partial [Longimicrobiaceae bacterium]|nr:ABC transporter permease [Longimicrobiaceae bacterium]
FAVGVTLASAVLFGVAPALRFSRPVVADALRGAGRGQVGPGRRGGLRGALVAGEVALALVLLIGAGLLGRSFLTLLDNDLGFRPERRATLQTFLWDRNPTSEQRVARVGALIARFEAVPGVERAAAVSSLPFHPHAITAADPLHVEGRARARPGEAEEVFTTVATPGYFGVMGIALRAGRGFTAADRAGAPPVALVSEALARRFFPGEDPVGRRITIGVMGPPVTREIVGVVAGVRPQGLDSPPRPELFVPHAQHGTGSMIFVARTRGRPGPLLPALQRAVWDVDPDQTVYHAATLESLVRGTLAERRFHLALLGTFSAVALALAVVGLYGLVSFSTAQRTGEIGIRMALGARGGEIVRMVVGQGVRVALPGIVAGIAGALLLTRFLRGMLYGVAPADPATYLQLAVLMVAVAAVAAFVPARRAAGVDPMTALRGE